ncbi:MAG: hypothetical protein QOH84_6101 [Kribbellaceae bacterium]|jgi:hypothetical protein|nr:hypothetical protein [Kribbellaceae bacterium]
MKCIQTIHHHKPIRTALAVLALAALPAGAVAVPAYAAQTSSTAVAAGCPTGWGSLPEASTYQGWGQLTNVRTGRHACYDRIVFDVQGKPSWFRAHYVTNFYTVGEGKLIPARGGAKLEIILSVSSFDSDDGVPSYDPPNYHELTNVHGYRTFRQIVDEGSFEGETAIGVGLRARLPFRVFTLSGAGNTSRIVVDVAHRW